ncbi:Tm-1-like ATP-binding domain-containing protein [Anatilimnocola floriformis]|uniref:Tm-1-like ATP-binding domain-containing protein n=1 Tax=Anatilimnocola floriformis TaxID=2948575 RepID=UPI0020C3AD5F|nr:Tm-1-like ATP-binding domain-containing protein [Anatilimnocola floriformis]
MTIYLFATLDTKGPEADFVARRLRELGLTVELVDTGCLGEPTVAATISREQLFAAGGASLSELQQQNDRGAAIAAAARGAEAIVRSAFQVGKVTGVIALGGSAGTTIGTAAMRALPIGVPKVMVSTLASGNVRPYVRDKDIVMLNSVVDIAGINRLSRQILNEAAAAIAGMVRFAASVQETSDRPLIAATMFGVTTPCVQHARKILEDAGYEVLIFHATGNGGEAMESLIRDGLVAGVLDITTTELADELVGGILSAGPTRLTAAGEKGIPQVISVGALDMVNFGPRETVPAEFAERLFYQHNANVTLMRTTPEECRLLGEQIARKAAAATGPVEILLPLRGVSALDTAGKAFDDPQAREQLRFGLHAMAGQVPIVEVDHHINDAAFAELATRRLLELLK